jgi:hypothetical protein
MNQLKSPTNVNNRNATSIWRTFHMSCRLILHFTHEGWQEA